MPKVAIFFDWLNQWGGAEQVLLDILKIYPQAHLYTLVYNPQSSPWLPPTTKVIPSFINSLPFSRHNSIIYTPIYDLALEQFDFRQYDIVIATTSVLGHCLLTTSRTLFLCYFHNLNRHLYSSNLPLLNLYQKIDRTYSHRPDHFLCNSHTVAKRLKLVYHRSSIIIHPGIDTHFFRPSSHPSSNYFLTVSRLVPHKKIDLVINAFNRLPHQKLIIVGTGRDYFRLKLLSRSPNINFVGSVDTHTLLGLYQNCHALICPQLEDFGLTSLEAQSCGKPVIAFGQGGSKETVIPKKTGIYFHHQTPASLLTAIDQFTSTNFSPKTCRTQAQKFSQHTFMLNFKKTVSDLWQQHQKNFT